MTMKKSLFLLLPYLILLIGIIPQVLVAQTQKLPPVEISSEVAPKAPLIKKPLNFNFEIPQDSIPPYLPRVYTAKYMPPAITDKEMQPLSLNIGMKSEFSSYLYAALFTNNSQLPFIDFDGNFSVPGTNRSLKNLQLRALSDFHPLPEFAHNLQYQEASSDSFSSSMVSYTLFAPAKNLTKGKISLNQVQTWINVENLNQKDNQDSVDDFSFGIRHSNDFTFKDNTFSNLFLFQDSAWGIKAQYHINLTPEKYPALEAGLMTDFNHLLPSINLHKRWITGPGKQLELENKAELTSFSLAHLKSNSPWTIVPEKDYICMSPLNLSNFYWINFKPENRLWNKIGFGQNIKFSYNVPSIYSNPVSGQTYYRFEEVFSYQPQMEFSFQVKDLNCYQNLKVNMEFLPDKNWQRKSYSPLLTAYTSIKSKYKNLNLITTLEQEYFRYDEDHNYLPFIFDLSLEAQYPIEENLLLSLQLQNLFNTPYQLPGNLPSSGRTVFLLLKYRPFS